MKRTIVSFTGPFKYAAERLKHVNIERKGTRYFRIFAILRSSSRVSRLTLFYTRGGPSLMVPS